MVTCHGPCVLPPARLAPSAHSGDARRYTKRRSLRAGTATQYDSQKRTSSPARKSKSSGWEAQSFYFQPMIGGRYFCLTRISVSTRSKVGTTSFNPKSKPVRRLNRQLRQSPSPKWNMEWPRAIGSNRIVWHCKTSSLPLRKYSA